MLNGVKHLSIRWTQSAAIVEIPTAHLHLLRKMRCKRESRGIRYAQNDILIFRGEE
jgi:hypothetical protein